MPKKGSKFVIRNRGYRMITITHPLNGFDLDIQDEFGATCESFSLKETRHLVNVLRSELKLASQCEIQLYDAVSDFLNNWYADGPTRKTINRLEFAAGKFTKLYGERRYGKWKDARE